MMWPVASVYSNTVSRLHPVPFHWNPLWIFYLKSLPIYQGTKPLQISSSRKITVPSTQQYRDITTQNSSQETILFFLQTWILIPELISSRSVLSRTHAPMRKIPGKHIWRIASHINTETLRFLILEQGQNGPTMRNKKKYNVSLLAALILGLTTLLTSLASLSCILVPESAWESGLRRTFLFRFTLLPIRRSYRNFHKKSSSIETHG